MPILTPDLAILSPPLPTPQIGDDWQERALKAELAYEAERAKHHAVVRALGDGD